MQKQESHKSYILNLYNCDCSIAQPTNLSLPSPLTIMIPAPLRTMPGGGSIIYGLEPIESSNLANFASYSL